MLPEYATQYRRLWNHHWWWQARKRFVLHWIRKTAACHRIGQILDIGCGDAFLFDDLERIGTVFGVEPDAQLISPDSPWRPRIEQASFDAGYETARRFDLVVMLDVLEHIEDDGGALRRVGQLLAPGGFLLMTVPALPVLWSIHDVANQHYRRYTLSGLCRRLRESGFEVWSRRYYFGWLVGPLLLRRLLFPGKNAAQASSYRPRVPIRPLNAAVRMVCLLEQWCSRFLPLPLGSSILAIARIRPPSIDSSSASEMARQRR